MKTILCVSGMVSLGLASGVCAIERTTPVQEPKAADVAPAPAGEIKEKAKEVKASGWLGIAGRTVNDSLLSYHLQINGGVAIQHLTPDGPAAKFGLKRRDIITSVDGKDVKSMDELRAALRRSKPNQELKISVISGGKRAERKVVVSARPAHFAHFHNKKIDPRDLKHRFGRGGKMPEGVFDQLGQADRERMEALMENQLKQMRKDFKRFHMDLGDVQVRPGQGQKMQQLKFDLNNLRQHGEVKFGGAVTMADEQGSVSLKMCKMSRARTHHHFTFGALTTANDTNL